MLFFALLTTVVPPPREPHPLGKKSQKTFVFSYPSLRESRFGSYILCWKKIIKAVFCIKVFHVCYIDLLFYYKPIFVSLYTFFFPFFLNHVLL